MQLHLDVAWWDEDGEIEEPLKQFSFESQIPDGYDKVFDAWLAVSRIPKDLWRNGYNNTIDSLMYDFHEIIVYVVETKLGYHSQDFVNGKIEINDPFVDEHGVMYAAVDINVQKKKNR